MLPQMMPLPWVMLFFLIFVCFYSVNIFIGSLPVKNPILLKALKSYNSVLPW